MCSSLKSILAVQYEKEDHEQDKLTCEHRNALRVDEWEAAVDISDRLINDPGKQESGNLFKDIAETAEHGHHHQDKCRGCSYRAGRYLRFGIDTEDHADYRAGGR